MNIEIEKQTLGSLARRSNVSTTEQVESYVEGYIEEYSKDTFVHLSGNSNIGTLHLSGDLKTTKIEANNVVFGYNNHSELCSVAEGSTNNAIAPFSHAEGDGGSYAGSKTFTIKTVSEDKLSITLDTDISQIQLSDELIIQNSGASDVKKITDIDASSKTIALDSIIGTSTKVGNYVMVMHKPWLGTVTKGDGAHVEGYKNMAFEDAHAENIYNTAYGKYSHCHGNANKAGWMATAFGTGNSALGNGSIALGGASATNGQYTVCDTNAIVKGANSFAWSGNGKYEVTKGGTFNINPIGGAKGFYIGQQSLPDIIHEIAEGRNLDDANSKIVKLDINGETLTTTILPTQIIDKNVNKFKSVYNSDTDEYEDIEKTIDEINDEVEHLYVMTTENDDEYNYYQITIANENGTSTYGWKKVTEKAKVSYIKKEGDTGIGPLQLTDNITIAKSIQQGSSIASGLSACALGVQTSALMNGSVTEGIKTLANGIYSHAEGYKTIVSAGYSHTEGNETKIYAPYSHAEGFKNIIYANYSHAEGSNNIINSGAQSHAEGSGNTINNTGHAEGIDNTINGNYSHAEGKKNKTYSNYSHVEGQVNIVGCRGYQINGISSDLQIMQLTSIAEIETGWTYSCHLNTPSGGNYMNFGKVLSAYVVTTPSSKDPTKFLSSYYISVDNCPTEAYTSTGFLWFIDHPEIGNVLAGQNAHAEGSYNSAQYEDAHVEGCQNTAAARFSHAEGRSNAAIGWASHAEGNETSAIGQISHSSGYKSIAKHSKSFAWNGGSNQYESHGTGTFNINPANSLNGFYIGENTLSNIIDNAIKAHDAEILKDVEFDTSSTQNIGYLINMLSTIINKLGGTVIS